MFSNRVAMKGDKFMAVVEQTGETICPVAYLLTEFSSDGFWLELQGTQETGTTGDQPLI
jgi:hypothetical protein